MVSFFFLIAASRTFLSLLHDSFESHLIGLFHPLLLNVAVMLRPQSHSVSFLTQGYSLNTNPALIFANVICTKMFIPTSTAFSPKQERAFPASPYLVPEWACALECFT